MTYVIPAEADWDSAPGLLDGAMSLVLTAEQCNLAYWLGAVAQGTLRNRVEYGHAPDPVEQFALKTVRDEGDFIGGVAIFTIVIEGVLAPAAELSERKWDLLDPAASEIARGASIDEIRHLTVGSSIIREHLIRHPEYRPRLMDILRAGRKLWDEVPDKPYVLRREELFQEGMQAHAERLAEYEVWPGRRLLDTTPEERYDAAERWTDQMAEARMAYMGLEDAVPILMGQG